MDPKKPDVLTLDQAARYVRLDKRTLAYLATAKKVPGKKIGGQWRFSRAVLEEFLGVPPGVHTRKPADRN